nr:MAG TPA: DNA polymerase I [Caudoviricetes sp.]
MYYTYVPTNEERVVQILVPDVNDLTGEQFVALQQAKKDAGIEGPIEVTDRATPGNRFTVGAFGAPGTWALDQLDRAARTEGRSQNSYGFEDIFDGTELHLDIETYSTVDLKKNTVYRYVEDEHWMILICSWCIGQGEIHTAYGHEEIKAIPGLFDPAVKKIAHNSDFERINFSALKGLPVGTYIDPEEYIDTAVLASLWGYPRSLKGFCKVVGGEAKDEAGGRLINMFSVPNRKGRRTLPEERPADWDAYVEYNRQDVISMRDNIYRLGKGFPSAEEYEAWITATRINDRGIKIDTALAGAAHRQYETNKKKDLARVKEITGLDNPNSVQQFKGWLAAQGFEMESIDKAHVAELLERDGLPDEVREAVERKQLAALSAATKYVIAQGSTNSDGRLRGTIKYSNANTGRMTGVTLSPHNLPRDHFTDAEGEHDTEAEQAAIDKLLAGVHVGSEDLKKLVRPLLVGPFTVSDYSAIEARLTAWAAGEDSVLESFRSGEDIYVATAERMGGEKAGFDRQRGKAATLGCGFGGGAGALLNLGGAKIYPKGTPDEVIWEGLTSLVEIWRVAHPHIVSWWKQVHTAFDKGGPASRRIPVDVEIVGNDRYVWLPSGRALVYHNCKREYVQPKDRNGKPLPYRRRAWVCDAVVGNGTQRRIVGGPTQVENIIQAIGRDLLTHALVNVERTGFRTVTHVHDEIVTETTGGLTVERLSSLMCDLPDWAEGLPVEAAGYTTQRYRKD